MQGNSRRKLVAVQAAASWTRADYLRAKVLHVMSANCHEQMLLFQSLKQDEMANAYSEASSGLHAQALKLFPLYPHADFMAGQTWARANGFDE
jgi:hypothetical protein